jgi:hypothetical protein
MLDKMDANITHEIKAAYEEMSEGEFFEHMDAESVEVDDIKKALGEGVVNEYMNWIYLNIK